MTKKEENYGPIWNEIKERNIEVFGLPGRSVASYFKPLTGDEKKLILTSAENRQLTAVTVALENLITSLILPVSKQEKGPLPFGVLAEKPKQKFLMDQDDRYVTLTLNT